MKPSLPSVTLMCADGRDADRAAAVLERCRELCYFGDVKLFTHLATDYPHRAAIQPLNSLLDYSLFMLFKVHERIGTPHMLVVQHDGWIINPQTWDDRWLEYDYTGPLFIHKHTTCDRSVGSGGFSLRTKRLMARVSELVAARCPPWDGTPESTLRAQKHLSSYEDGVISLNFRNQLVDEGFKFAPPAEAAKFAQGGNRDLAYYVERPFGFHGHWWENIDISTGIVRPWKPHPGE